MTKALVLSSAFGELRTRPLVTALSGREHLDESGTESRILRKDKCVGAVKAGEKSCVVCRSQGSWIYLRLTGGPWAGQLTSPDLRHVVSKTVPATLPSSPQSLGEDPLRRKL